MTERVRHPDFRLGRISTPPQAKARNLKLASYLPRAPRHPATADVSSDVTNWPMYANDRLGDCTCAAAGHMIEVWTKQVDGVPRILQDSDIVALYNQVNGGQDEGADPLQVLNVWRQQGLASDKILAFAEVDVKRLVMAKAGMYLFSGLYIGLALPQTAQSQVGGTWDVVPNAGPQGAPGSWGGHMINGVAYNPQGVDIITWGRRMRMTWAFWKAYVDEAYVAVPTDYDRLQGKPLANGFNEAKLLDDLKRFTPVG